MMVYTTFIVYDIQESHENIFKLSYTIAMTKNKTALAKARRNYEGRTALKIVTLRLGAEARERLERLAGRYGGKRAAVETALELLEKSTIEEERL